MINKIGIIGIIVAFLGITVAIFQDDIRKSIEPKNPGLSAQALAKGKALLTGKKDTSEHDKIDYVYIGLGLLAFVLGVISYLRKENHRISATSAALGIIAIAWHYVLIGVVIAIIILVIGGVS